MKLHIQVLVALSFFCASLTGHAAIINSFAGTYDTVNNRALFSFNVDTVDATTPNGIDNFYLDFDEFDLWSATSTLLDATTSNSSIVYLDEDEMFVNFDVVTGSNVTMEFLFGDINLTNFTTSSWAHDWGFNQSTWGSSLGDNQWLLSTNHNQNNWTPGTLGTSIGAVPEPSTLALISLILAGLGLSRRRA